MAKKITKNVGAGSAYRTSRQVPAYYRPPASKGRPVPIPYRNLPVWQTEKDGDWRPLAGDPEDECEWLYYERLTGLIERKWPVLVPGAPWPVVKFARMKPADGSDQWCSVDMLVLEKPAGADWSVFLESLEEDNLVQYADQGRYAYISPFFEWGLADYWENGYYDR